MLANFACVAVALCLTPSAFGQTELISPQDSAIIQVRNGKGELHLSLQTDAKTTLLQFRILDSVDKPLKGYDWSTINFKHRSIDTILSLPLVQDLTLQWRTDGRLEGGLLTHLKIGHLFAIAGQSNAQGWSAQPVADLKCDARMLWNDYKWHVADDPTGGKWGSPWIEFANQFASLVHDSLPIGIINTAVGGTGLTLGTGNGRWLRNGEFHFDTNTVYGASISRIREAGSDVEALFWIQGETDAISTTVKLYQSTFFELHREYEEDLKYPVKVFLLQIGGQSNNPGKFSWGVVREALRTMPNTTLVGSSIGLPTGDDIHYSIATARTVGERFAGAVAKEIYEIDNALYPPPIPGVPKLVTCQADDPRTGWKIEVPCLKGGKTCRLAGDVAPYGFQLTHDASRYDTSEVFANIDPHDPTKVDIFLKHHLIAPDPTWRVSYAIYGDVRNVTLSDGVNSPSGLPNMLVAFLDLPVFDSAFLASLAATPIMMSTTLVSLSPNPAQQATTVSLKLSSQRSVSLLIFDILGRSVRTVDPVVLSGGDHAIVLDCKGLSHGSYFVAVRTVEGTLTSKLFITEP
jgi:hypothetical protein